MNTKSVSSQKQGNADKTNQSNRLSVESVNDLSDDAIAKHIDWAHQRAGQLSVSEKKSYKKIAQFTVRCVGSFNEDQLTEDFGTKMDAYRLNKDLWDLKSQCGKYKNEDWDALISEGAIRLFKPIAYDIEQKTNVKGGKYNHSHSQKGKKVSKGAISLGGVGLSALVATPCVWNLRYEVYMNRSGRFVIKAFDNLLYDGLNVWGVHQNPRIPYVLQSVCTHFKHALKAALSEHISVAAPLGHPNCQWIDTHLQKILTDTLTPLKDRYYRVCVRTGVESFIWDDHIIELRQGYLEGKLRCKNNAKGKSKEDKKTEVLKIKAL